MFKAEIIADSKNQCGNRITTFIVTFPRIILAEFNAHRMLSRNSASSRAIPFEKMLKSVKENPFVPIKWMKDHKGMQGTEYFTESHDISTIETGWLVARDNAIKMATILSNMNVTKQVINRLLEPFMWHTVIVTATEWENFFALRANEAAEIHMQRIAYMMLYEYNKSTPYSLLDSQWHIPFRDKIDEDLFSTEWGSVNEIYSKISTAMCARVSYTVVGQDIKESDYEKDIQLHDKLLDMGHMSPFEHCAQCLPTEIMRKAEINRVWSGNFRGFIQYRKTIEGENKSDIRIIKK